MRISEMTSNEFQVYRIVVDTVNEFIGGFENQLLDSREGSKEYEEAKNALDMSHDDKVIEVLSRVRADWRWKRIENLHFCTLEWVKERVNLRLKKIGF